MNYFTQDKKQSIIEVLAKQNSAAPERLKEQRKQVDQSDLSSFHFVVW